MPGYLALLLKALKDHGASSISDVVMTHYHRDHTEGLKELRRHFGEGLRAWKAQPQYGGSHGPSFTLASQGVKELSAGQLLTTEDGSASLRVVLTPGHTPDHICLFLQEVRASSQSCIVIAHHA